MRDNLGHLVGNGHSQPVAGFDVAHVDALWEIASVVCSETSVNPAEAYVLGCVFAAQTAAMAESDQVGPDALGTSAWCDLVTARFVEATGRWPTDTEITDPPVDISDACLAEAVWLIQPQRVMSLIDRPLAAGPRWGDFYLIDDPELRDAYGQVIGQLAASLWWDAEDLPARFPHLIGSPSWLPAEWVTDPLKLACIARAADAAHIDGRRPPTVLFARRHLHQAVSRNGWFPAGPLSRPQLAADQLTFISMRPVTSAEAPTWWTALDYLRDVDRELRRVDALLVDLGKPRLAARGVASIETPERFAEVFPVAGWEPVDADLRISDVRRLVGLLGDRLWEPKDALRELIHNAQYAAVARQAIDSTFTSGQVTVSLDKLDGAWILEVGDNGIGMDQDLLLHGLLDVGCSGWRTDTLGAAFPGLASTGFQADGTLGLGFYAVFQLGDDVTVTTRRFDLGQTDARQLHFTKGLNERPLLTKPAPATPIPPGTTIQVHLATDPHTSGLLAQLDDLTGLVDQLDPLNAVPIHITDPTERPEPSLSS